MGYLNNKLFAEIKTKAKNGDEKAKSIIDKFINGGDQESLDRLVDDYFRPEGKDDPYLVGEEEKQPEIEVKEEIVSEPKKEDPIPAVEDISSVLDGELDGLIDKDEIEDGTFDDYIKNKHRDSLRGKKNHDYFCAFDPDGRHAYCDKKKDEYGHSFDTKRKDIERTFRDMDGAIDSYATFINDQPDDNIDSDVSTADNAYEDIIGSVGKSHSFGRNWDEEDMTEVKDQLLGLMKQYGKKNVVAALNILRGDNAAYRDHRNNSIDRAVKNYGSKLDELLK